MSHVFFLVAIVCLLCSALYHMFIVILRKILSFLATLGPVSLMSDFDTLLFIVGSLPDQNIDVISDYMSQLFSGEDTLRIHAVAYDCSHHLVNALLKTITTSASAFASLAST
ncbi:unnamed protein product [Rotaria sp. Silwood2]|nr:unnamed protein product [Rotaria sp. Silwood2]